MAIVGVVIMISFIGGSALRMLLSRSRFGRAKPLAYCFGGQKITALDLYNARKELEILKMVGADVLMRSIRLRDTDIPDLRAFFLGEVLFGDRTTAPASIGELRRAVRQNNYRINLKQIDALYDRTVPPNIYWLLLTREASRAGVEIPNADAGRYLATSIPNIRQGATYTQVISAIVSRHGIGEETILRTFSKLLAVLQYGRMVCSTTALTTAQMQHLVARGNETIDARYVTFDAGVFADEQAQPPADELAAHFEKYKNYFPGQVTADNPYGFGYKLPEMLSFEYIAVRLDEIKKIIDPPTPEDVEQYYMDNRQQFTQQIPADPNDPNSKPTTRIRTFPEVANAINTILVNTRARSKAAEILEKADFQTRGSLNPDDQSQRKLDPEKLKQLAGDYAAAARKLSESYGTNVYAGRTGLLTAADVRQDSYLGRLYLQGRSQSLTSLVQVLFAVEDLKAAELGPLGVQAPALYENVGPFRDISGRVMLMARVVRVRPAGPPESIDTTFSRRSLKLDPNQPVSTDVESQDEDLYSVRRAVSDDLAKLAAMPAAADAAKRFKALVAQLGWDDAIERVNQLYGPADANTADPNLPDSEKPFRLDTFTGRRISSDDLLTLSVQNEGNPVAGELLRRNTVRRLLTEKLYQLVPPDSNNLDAVPYIMEFKPELTYYCLKSLSVSRISEKQYQQSKPLAAYLSGIAESQSLAVLFFNPANILKRTGFVRVETADAPRHADEPNQPPGGKS